MESGPEPENVCVPPKRAPLARDGKVVYVLLPWLNWALCNVRRPIGPARSKLSHSVPFSNILEFQKLENSSYVKKNKKERKRRDWPMDGEIVFDVVDHLDQNGVVLSCIYSWTREPSVHCDNGLGWTQFCAVLQHHLNSGRTHKWKIG